LPSPSASASEAVALPISGAIPPGTYYRNELTTGGESARVTFTMPSGWTASEGSFLYKNEGQPGEVMFVTWIVTHIFEDACEWNIDELVEIESPQVLIQALSRQAPREETAGSWPWSGTIGGLAAEGVELEVAAEFDTSSCTSGNLRYWPDAGPNFNGGLCCNQPGNTDFVYAVDVNGITMAVVARHYPDSTAQDREELQSILDSLQIEP
jgi:hypothetical protein